MPIDRTAFDALVDDDGTNTTGTPWNKTAIQNVILDPVDDALGASGIPDAPVDGTTYGRKNAAWEPVTATLPGAWTAVTFNAADFTCSGSMTITISSGHVQNFSYQVFGKTMMLAINLNGFTLGGSASSQLKVKIPGGYTPKKNGFQIAVISDPSTHNNVPGIASLQASVNQVAFVPLNGVFWATIADQSAIATLFFEIN